MARLIVEGSEVDPSIFTWRRARKRPITVKAVQVDFSFEVETLEGVMSGGPGDWLVMGIQGELYPCKDNIFRETYEIDTGGDTMPCAITPHTIKECHHTAVEKGFWEADDNLGAKIALIHSEVSECLEALRQDPPDMDNAAEELADICIRVFDLAGYLNLDLIQAIHKKMERNRERPYLHGKRF